MSVKIMVIEDNDINRELIREILQTRDRYELVMVEDGHRGLEKIKEAAPDLILLDIQLPGLNGYEVLKRIKKRDKFKDLPVIGVTAYAMKGDRDKILEAGFDEYLPKPIDMEELFQKIEKVIN